ncbi:carboxylating nicotinate-nucleotide diphosphorylase [Panacibacter ginsenosidivorans]|uniref:Probable nicotinate-nucleotide pyrophosphorylase [carboxylating] n=1 Tax=Panacibacter ginsenosidivorans TaxID=1813871 RepID=A0A5B8V9T9_9BACT|nr:carboxylating nicotinate-nucleotide diphosphorylase [Panacibacter ginsenosidivorans]QEC68194.1 carboxylating nicotinate-nucleotide diphosphorylase [Panacibacter ginsenosidivorans]
MKSFDEQLEHLVREALAEDVGDGDHSTLSCIPADKKGKAVLKIKQDGILAGVEVAKKIFTIVEPAMHFQQYKQDGDTMQFGEKAFEVEASIHTILICERLVLNCMQRMSGIATLTHTYVETLKGYHTRILDTRKTTPNFRLLEKEAVKIGGGMNHRFGLFDMIMLKDNHIEYAGGLEAAINKAYNYTQTIKPGLKIEVETRSMDDVKTVCNIGKGKVFRIMLDNFEPVQITEALTIINRDFETEASGGINLDNIIFYAATGVDYVSVGGLIHQAKSLDLSLKAVII